MTRLLFATSSTLGLALLLISIAQQPSSPNATPLYLPCPRSGVTCNEDLGHDIYSNNTKNGCTKWCTEGPMNISPDPVEGCQGLPVTINVRVVGGRMDTVGNAIVNYGGFFDWGDGQQTAIFSRPGLNEDLTHTYGQALEYYPSATYAQQFAYTGDGSCGYRCRQQQATVAIIYLPNSPECATGTFKPTENSKTRKAKALDKLHQVVHALVTPPSEE